MPINIKNREAERLLDQLSAATGKGKSQLVLELLRREAGRQAKLAEAPRRRQEIERLARRFARRAAADPRSPDEIVGYGPDGLPR